MRHYNKRVAHRPAPTHRTVSVPNTHGVENVARGVTNVSPTAVAGNCLSRLARTPCMNGAKMRKGEGNERTRTVKLCKTNFLFLVSSLWEGGAEGVKRSGENSQATVFLVRRSDAGRRRLHSREYSTRCIHSIFVTTMQSASSLLNIPLPSCVCPCPAPSPAPTHAASRRVPLFFFQ